MAWFISSRTPPLSRRSREHSLLPQNDWDEEADSDGPDRPEWSDGDDHDHNDRDASSSRAATAAARRTRRSSRDHQHDHDEEDGYCSASSSSSSSSTAPADFLLCASPGSARRRRLGTAVSTLLTLGVGVSIAGLTFLADDSRRLCEASRDRRHVSCFFSPRHMMELLKDSVACGIQCMSKSSGEVCCPNNLGSSTVCAPNSECCDGLCAVPGTMCADVCSPGLISCGGTCLVGTEEDTCCVGPSGAGIVCAPGAECCNGLCMDEGQGCASECDPGLVSCGGVCLPGNSSDQCCLGPTGSGILCEASAECCDGICLQDGHGCAKTCAPGMVPCGGLCLPGQGEDICCMGPSGSGILCNSDAQCCEGICVMGGQGCSSPCGAGLIKCGGLCLPGSPDAQCCLGASGNGILCGPNSTCCDGLCMLEGQGCSKTCAEGLIQCGGECLPSLDISSNNSSSNNNNNNDIDATNVAGSCCVGPEGRGILCTPDAECCSGLCMAKGQGCADTCGEGLVKCGSTCLPGLLTDKCCLNSDGVGLLCDGDDECCDGLCIAAGSSCGTACRKGMMLCGNECLVGDPTKDQCCLGSSGFGIICEASAECCDGLCFEKGEGCSRHCREGTIECGGLCLPAEEGATCCTGSSSTRSHGPIRHLSNRSGQTSSSSSSSSSNISTSSNADSSRTSSSTDSMRHHPEEVVSGIICGAGTTCCDGFCILEGEACGGEVCDHGLRPCGGLCLPAVESGTCCVGPTGAGAICGPEEKCCSGLCKAKGTPCSDEEDDLPVAI